jgi:hypothetical protein
VPEININKNNEIGKVVQSKCNLAHRFGRGNRISALFEGEKKTAGDRLRFSVDG